jgi:hypothetical protein
MRRLTPNNVVRSRATGRAASGRGISRNEVPSATTIESVHLRLLLYSPEYLLALIEGYERFEERFGLPAAEGLRASLVSNEVSPA